MKITNFLLILAALVFMAVGTANADEHTGAASKYCCGGYVAASIFDVNTTFGSSNAYGDQDDGKSVAFGWHIVPQSGFRPKISAEIEYSAFDNSTGYADTDMFGEVSYDLVYKYKDKYDDKVLKGKRYSPKKPELVEIRPEDIQTKFDLDSQMMTAWLRTQWRIASVSNRNINLDARAGVSVAELEANISNAYGNASYSATGVGPAFGVGLSANITSHLGAFVRYEEHKIDVALAGEQIDYDPELFKVGLEYRF